MRAAAQRDPNFPGRPVAGANCGSDRFGRPGVSTHEGQTPQPAAPNSPWAGRGHDPAAPPTRDSQPGAEQERLGWNVGWMAACAVGSRLNVGAGCGTLIRKRKYLPQLLTDIVARPELANVQWLSRGPRSKAGHPHPPLYVRADALLDAFDVSAYLATL